MINFGYDVPLICAMLVIFATVISAYMINFDTLMNFTAAATKNNEVNSSVTHPDQVSLQEGNISSNQSRDIKAIKNSMSEQVQLLRNMTLGFARASTQTSFAALCVFLLGLTLLLYGLRLTVKATSKETSMYFKVMMYALIAPVIVVLVIYQLGVIGGISLESIRIKEPFFLISLILWIPAGIVIFLLVVEKRVLAGFHQKHP